MNVSKLAWAAMSVKECSLVSGCRGRVVGLNVNAKGCRIDISKGGCGVSEYCAECSEWSYHGTGTSSAVFVSDVCEG